MTINDSGNVGIGTTSPVTRLHTAGPQSTAGVARLGFSDSSSVALFTNSDKTYGTLFGTLNNGKGWIQQQRVDGTATAYDLILQPNGGYVGINTTSPEYKLHISTGSVLSSTAGAQQGLLKLQTSTGNVDYLEVTNTRTNTGTTWTTAGFRLQQKVDATWMGYIQFNNPNFGISFGTGASTVSATSISERMRIDSDGKVGIGTTSPTQRLSVDGGSIILNYDNAAANYYLFLNRKSGHDGGIVFQIDNTNNWQQNLDSSGNLYYYSYTTGTNVITLQKSTGNVGINATNPFTKLQVSGSLSQKNGNVTEYKNVVTYAFNDTATGGYLIKTPFLIGTSFEMVIINVKGYGYGANSVVDFKVVFYDYNIPPAPTAYSIVDSGNDGLIKYLGKDASGYVYIAFGGLSDSNYYYRFTVDCIVTVNPGRDYSSGWSFTQTTSANYGLSALYALSPAITQRTSGNVGIGNISPLYKLDVNGSTRILSSLAVGNILPSATVGRIDASNDVVAFSTSDIRFKTNITPISGALEKITQIGGYEFDWIPNQEHHGFEGHDVGVIAQEIEKVLPEVIKERNSGYKAVKYEKIVPLLIEAIKEQQKQIDELKYLLQNKI
jgi:hypothetical protein